AFGCHPDPERDEGEGSRATERDPWSSLRLRSGQATRARDDTELRGYFFFDFDDDFFFGTFAPARRASDSPMAMACLRLFTFLPELPLLSVPCLRSCITFSTFFDAFLLYLRAMLQISLHKVRARHEPEVGCWPLTV